MSEDCGIVQQGHQHGKEWGRTSDWDTDAQQPRRKNQDQRYITTGVRRDRVTEIWMVYHRESSIWNRNADLSKPSSGVLTPSPNTPTFSYLSPSNNNQQHCVSNQHFLLCVLIHNLSLLPHPYISIYCHRNRLYGLYTMSSLNSHGEVLIPM